jgi:hypothetical protein
MYQQWLDSCQFVARNSLGDRKVSRSPADQIEQGELRVALNRRVYLRSNLGT